jgi:acyl-[acyl-carrier-protein]-phospholipid O-acyltransferase/long-chain-fatty-acid--[acyl-carrier-protein] ligase
LVATVGAALAVGLWLRWSTSTMNATRQFDNGNASWLGGFWSLIGVQFQGAFSDNLLKWLVTFLVLEMSISAAERDRLVVLVIPLLFSVPFLLFSMAGGYFADRYSKRRVTIATKQFEIAVALVALAGLTLNNLGIECTAVFLLSVQAALFGPSKYGLLPELLPEKRLSWGNGILELGTFIAIITGTMAAGMLADRFRGREYWPGMLLVALGVVGLAISMGITRVPAADPARRFKWNPAADLWEQIGRMRRDRLLLLAVIGNVFFWFLGALVLINTALYAADELRISETQTSLLLAAISIGIGVGSFATGYLSAGKVEYGLVPVGAVGIALMLVLLARPGLSFADVAWDLSWVGFFGGFFAVPLNAMIQHRPKPEEKGGIIAAANLLSFVGIALQPVAQYLLIFFGHPSPPRVFFLTGLLTLAATAVALMLQPDSLLRLALWAATHTAWPLRVEGRANLPERGPAMVVFPGMRLSDAMWLVAATDRTLRFLLPPSSARAFGKWLGAIPFDASPEGMRQAGRAAAEALERGEVVCLPEEARAIEASVDGTKAPVIPVTIAFAGPFARSVVRFGSAVALPSSPSRDA